MQLRHISSFGVELEGIFNHSRLVRGFDDSGSVESMRRPIGNFLHGDGSVGGDFPTDSGGYIHDHYNDGDDDAPYNDCGCGDSDCETCQDYYREREFYEASHSGSPNYRCGEWSSPPIFPTRLTTWASHLTEFWPDSVNDSCGLHMHLGLRTPRDYARLIDIGTSFANNLVTMLRDNFESSWRSWPERRYALRRLEGTNQYCEIMHDENYPTQQFLGSGSRYTAVNFTAFRRYGTVELRILPAIRHADRGIEMLTTVLNFSDNFLHTDARKLAIVERKKIKVVAEVDTDNLITQIEL